MVPEGSGIGDTQGEVVELGRGTHGSGRPALVGVIVQIRFFTLRPRRGSSIFNIQPELLRKLPMEDSFGTSPP